jgi:hypothetical protein
MTTHERYLDELLHDAWIPLPPVQIDDAVVLQCHRDADRKRSYFRVTLNGSTIDGFDDPEERQGMKVLGVAVTNGLLCFEGVEGGELRLRTATSIKHAAAGSVEDTRSWTAKLGLSDAEAPPAAVEVVPVVDVEADD